MALYEFSAPRLFVEADLAAGVRIALGRDASNYLLNVLRLGADREVLAFNGRDGEWRARIAIEGRRQAALDPAERVREQPRPADLAYLFAPLKHARLDYMVQKAVEMGASALQPVFTRRTVPTRVNRDRMRANAVEAAEQCGILSVPDIRPELTLDAAVAALGPEVTLVVCDEDAAVGSPLSALAAVNATAGLALLVGPEGGFAPEERAWLMARPNVIAISLGPRILRADTAAVAALAVLQAKLGDWRAIRP